MCKVLGHESQEIEKRSLIGAGSNKSETFEMRRIANLLTLLQLPMSLNLIPKNDFFFLSH